MRKKRRNGRTSTKTSIEDEIAHLRGLDLKGLRVTMAERISETAGRTSAAAFAVSRSSPIGFRPIASAI